MLFPKTLPTIKKNAFRCWNNISVGKTAWNSRLFRRKAGKVFSTHQLLRTNLLYGQWACIVIESSLDIKLGKLNNLSSHSNKKRTFFPECLGEKSQKSHLLWLLHKEPSPSLNKNISWLMSPINYLHFIWEMSGEETLGKGHTSGCAPGNQWSCVIFFLPCPPKFIRISR